MSERLQRYLLWLLAVTLVAGTGLALKYARGYRPVAGYGLGVSSPLPGDIAIRFNQVRAVGRENNRRTWILNADRIDSTQTRSRVDFSGKIEATLLDNELPRATLTGRQATFDANARLLFAAGNITGKILPVALSGSKGSVSPDASSSLRFEASEVVWNVGSRLVSCPGKIEIDLPGTTIHGENLTVDLRTRDFSLKHLQAQTILSDDSASDLPDALNSLKGLIP